MASIICPLCRLPLAQEPARWFCERGHSFDVAREGYVNLLPVQHKNSREPGDSADSLQARRAFLEAGHYAPLRDALVAHAAQSPVTSVLDVGCGEGYYTSAFATIAAEVIGVDIAKPAIQMASRRYPGLHRKASPDAHRAGGMTWLVGSGALLPLADASVDLVASLFSQLYVAEMHRVLAPGGRALVVTPAPDHLFALREGLFDEVKPHEPEKFLAGFEPLFELQAHEVVRFPLELTQVALRQLITMTPYAWKARPERRAALEARDGLMTEAAFSIMRLARRSPAA